MKVYRQIIPLFTALLLLTVLLGSPYLHNHHDSLVDEKCPVYLLQLMLVIASFILSVTVQGVLTSYRFLFKFTFFIDITSLKQFILNRAPPVPNMVFPN